MGIFDKGLKALYLKKDASLFIDKVCKYQLFKHKQDVNAFL